MEPNKELNEAKSTLIKEIENIHSGLTEKYPIKDYLRILKRYPKYAHYKYVSKDADRLCNRIIADFSKEALSHYHQLLLIELIFEACIILRNSKYTKDIINFYNLCFIRIINRIKKLNVNLKYYQYPNDKFFKDLGICKLTLIPAGPVLVDIGRLPLRYMLKKGLAHFIKGLILVFILGGIMPVLKMHTNITNSDFMREFNEIGWKKFFIRIGMILKEKKKIKGIYTASWLFDPNLKDVSPELGYLYRIIKDCHGKFKYIGTDKGTVRDATFLNAVRKRLYDEGKYKPKSYAFIIKRKNLIDYAEQNRMEEI